MICNAEFQGRQTPSAQLQLLLLLLQQKKKDKREREEKMTNMHSLSTDALMAVQSK